METPSVAGDSEAVARMRAQGLIGSPEPIKRGLALCSCGCREAHVIAKRETADGVRVEIWSDGDITRRGFALPGVGQGRSNWSRRAFAQAARDLCDDIALFTIAELPAALKAARKENLRGCNWSSDADRRNTIVRNALKAVA